MTGMLLFLIHCGILFTPFVFSESQIASGDTGLVCAIDLGSNTFKFTIAEVRAGKYLSHVDIRKTAGVGDDLKASEKTSGRKIISHHKWNEIKSMLTQFQDECERRTGSRKLDGIATAAFREAQNGSDIVHELLAQGVQIQVLSTAEESAFAYEAATMGEEGFSVVDLGSRTTEFVNKRGNTYEWEAILTGYKVSWDEYYEKQATFQAASRAHLSKLNKLIGEKAKKILREGKELVAIEIGETASYVLGIPQNQIEGKLILHSQIRNRLNELSNMSPEAYAGLKKTFADASRVLPRLVLVDLILEQTGIDRLRCTDRELNVTVVLKMRKS